MRFSAVSVWRNGTPTPVRSWRKWMASPFEDLVDGTSVAENTDEATGFTKRVVIDWRTNQRGNGLEAALAIARNGAVASSIAVVKRATCCRLMPFCTLSRARRFAW